MIESKETDNLLRTPIITKIPATNSANAIGICISGGSPMSDKKLENPGLDLAIP